MSIDPTTNLPELPEGYLWYISRYGVHIVTPDEDSEWLHFDCKIGTPAVLETRVVTKTVPVTKTRKEVHQDYWFCSSTTKTVTYEEEEEVELTEYRYVNRIRYVESALTEETGRIRRDFGLPEHFNVTPADVLPLCAKALQAFNDKRRSKEELEQLVGLYPPKKFVADS